MALGPVYHDLPLRPKARHWFTLNKTNPITRDLVLYCPMLADPGSVAGDQRDLGKGSPAGVYIWDSIAGDHFELQEFGDLAVPDGTTDYFSYLPAGGFDPFVIPQPGEPYTVMWFGRWNKLGSTTGVWGLGNPTIGIYGAVYRGGTQIRFIERAAGSGTRSETVAEPNDVELVVIITRSDGSHSDMTVQGIRDGATAVALVAGTNDISALVIGAIVFGTPSFLGSHQSYAFGLWRRWMSDDELDELTEDPFLPMRPTPEAALLHLVRRPLPCPGYPVVRAEERPHDQSDGAEGTIILAAYAPRIRDEVIHLSYDNLTTAEQVEIEVAYDGGRGLAAAFRFTIPGDTGPSLVVFEEPIRLAHQSAVAAALTVKLRVVNPADWLMAPRLISAATDESNSVTLNVPNVVTGELGLALICAAYTRGGSAGILRFDHRVVPPVTAIPRIIQAPISPPPGTPQAAIGVLFDAPVSVGGETVATVFTGTLPDDNAMAVLVASGVKAVNASAGVVLSDPAGLTPTLQITTTVDNCLIIFAAHGSFDAQVAAMSIVAPARQHALVENTTAVTQELIIGSVPARRAGTHTVTVTVTDAVTANVRLVAVALEPLEL